MKAAANMVCATDNNSDGIARLIREKIQKVANGQKKQNGQQNSTDEPEELSVHWD